MITIRKARQEDAASVAQCLLLAMEEIVYQLIGRKDARQATECMLYFVQGENNQYSYQNCWVAQKDSEVVAAVNVYDGAKLHDLRDPVLEHIKSFYHNDVLPEDETGAGEYYIDSVGVLPAYQGSGIGSMLLQFLMEEYVQKQGQTLGLLVDEENPNAKRLYSKLGFQTIDRQTLLGKKVEHLQLKPGTLL